MVLRAGREKAKKAKKAKKGVRYGVNGLGEVVGWSQVRLDLAIKDGVKTQGRTFSEWVLELCILYP